MICKLYKTHTKVDERPGDFRSHKDDLDQDATRRADEVVAGQAFATAKHGRELTALEGIRMVFRAAGRFNGSDFKTKDRVGSSEVKDETTITAILRGYLSLTCAILLRVKR